MKKATFFLPTILFSIISITTFAQKYTTAADTVKLNREYVALTNSIANHTSELTSAKNYMPKYQSRAANAETDAQNMAAKSSDQASRAKDGDIHDIKKAKRESRRALKDARGARTAENRVQGQDKYISKLTSKLAKEQERLQELEAMRIAIRNNQ